MDDANNSEEREGGGRADARDRDCRHHHSRKPSFGSMFLQSCIAAGCATIIVPAVLFAMFLIFMMLFVVPKIPDADKLQSYSSVASGPRERVVREGTNKKDATVAIVTIQGAIDGGGSSLEGSGMVSWVTDQVRAAAKNEDVKAIILQIDSPGGGLTASDQIHYEIQKAKEGGVAVLAWAGDMMASGGYYVAVAADGIMASPTSTVGSIGVIMQHFDVAGLIKTLGVTVDPIASAEQKDIGSPFRAMTDGERKYLQEYIDKNNNRFIDIVAKGRKLPREDVAKLADGLIHSAADALRLGLVDRVGYIDDAIAWAEEMTGEKGMRVISYRRLFSLGDLLKEAGQGAASALSGSAPKAMAVRADAR